MPNAQSFDRLERFRREPLEELGVLRDSREGSPLDIVEPEFVKPPRDEDLVLERKAHALALGPVA